MMIIYALALTVFCTMVWLAYGIWRIGAVSRGQPIDDRAREALLLIDLQSVFWNSGFYDEVSKSAAKAVIMEEINASKANGIPVIALRQEWSLPSTKIIARLAMKGAAIKGTPGTELIEPFAGLADHILVKRVQDSFETGELDRLLAKLEIGNIRIVGLDFNHCVAKTALAASNRGFGVTIVTEGTLAASPTDAAKARLVSQGVVLE